MPRETISLENLKETLKKDLLSEPENQAVTKDAQGRVYATGKRKTSVARVWIKPGKGAIHINTQPIDAYWGRETLRAKVDQPFRQTNRLGQYDVWCTVIGGGTTGQAEAIRHGISKALQIMEPSLRSPLKQADLLTRDAREVERKKAGRAGARRSFQFSKR